MEAALELDSDSLLASQIGSQIFGFLIMIAILGYPIYRFYEFTTRTPRAIENRNHAGFAYGIIALKSTFKYLGIAVLIIIGIYVLFLVLGVVAFIFMDLANPSF